ncbi:MAG: Cupin 2, conserved barrel domain protein [Blastococcus sp.]|nr:Cupin 2, conserved barrel domain protein [Blastococcus sp.]
MTGVRRVVTGFDPDGRSVVVEDAVLDPAPYGEKGGGVYGLWATVTPPEVPADRTPSPVDGLTPEPGGFRAMLLQIAASDSRDWEAFVAQKYGELGVPGMPGMHATPTVDVCTVLAGTVGLELDDGVELSLSTGDVVVQRGTRHRWHNRGEGTALLMAVLVGALRTTDPAAG